MLYYRSFTRSLTIKSLQQIYVRHIKSASTQFNNSSEFFASIKKPKEKWDLHASILVERLPVITKSLKPIEKEFQQLLWQIEFENSLKSDHELQHEKDLKQAELLKKGEIELDLDETATSKLTAQDKKDAYTDEYKKFVFAPRITDADKNNDSKSIYRKLEDTLYLVIGETQDSKCSNFILPQGNRQEGETMRQTAERVLQEKCGKNINVTFYGNAPCGFYKYKYPLKFRKDSAGVKIFFFRAAYKRGNVDEEITKKYEWLTQEDLAKTLKKPYLESIQSFLLE